jgi:protein-tyrosine-phosphatase/predicted ATP-grasp superfamily ATP-dependent carboligase
MEFQADSRAAMGTLMLRTNRGIVDTTCVRSKVLVLDADSAAGAETIQSLGRIGCIVDAVSSRSERTLRRSRFIHRQVRLSFLEEEGVSELVDLFRAENYDLIVPATEISLLTILAPEIPGEMYQRAVLPPRENVQTALDKQAVWNLARRIGVQTPLSEIVTCSSLPPKTFPVVLKPIFSKKSTSGGIVQDFRVTIARDLKMWRTALASIDPGVPIQQQEYIAGKGFGVEMLFELGEPRWVFLHERVHELPLTGGGSSYRVSIEPRADLVRSATSLLSALQWHGAAMVEFKVTADGEAYLMEINPRLWGSLALAIDCGVNFPVGLLCLSTGRPLPSQPEYRTAYFTRNIYRDIEWFKANLKADRTDPLLLTKPVVASAVEWLRPLTGKESWDFFCWSDLRTVLREISTLIQEHWSKCVSVAKRRSRRFYLRYFQQPRTIRKLQRRRLERVLILCYGNICRSPLAAALAAQRFPNASISSAGFHSATGRLSPDFVVSAAERIGVDIKSHRSRRVDSKMISDAQLILIMDESNYEFLKRDFPQALEKTLFLGMLLPMPQLEIKDPYDNPDSMPQTVSKMKDAISYMPSVFHG